MKNKPLKIGVVHDHLGSRGGGERTVLLLALKLGADFITAYLDKNTFPEYQNRLGKKLKPLSEKIITTRVVRFFWLRFLFWENRELFESYDILIASGQTATEVVARHAKPKTLKIVYTHTTPRRVFDQYEFSKNRYPWFLRGLYAVFARYWKWLYLRAIRKYDVNLANSESVRKRIKDHTGGDANGVVRPPILTEKFKWVEQGDYFLSWGRLDELKRVELVVQAFQKMPEQKLIVASGGPRENPIRELAEGYSNIEFLGWVSEEKLYELVGKCRAAIYIPIEEDAGMTNIEANAAGKPVIGVNEGGLRETIVDGETGILIKANPGEEDLIEAVRKMTPEWCLGRKETCITHSQKYSMEVFTERMRHFIRENDPRIPLLGIDASRWEDPRRPGEGRRTGVEVYAKELIENLIPLARKRGIRVRIYTPRTIEELPLEIQKVIPGKKQWTRKYLARELKYSPPDYFFTPSYYIPRIAPKNSFATIHDVIFKTNPEKYSFFERLRQDYVTGLNLKRAKKIFTVSQFSKNEIARIYEFNPEKIVVASIGHDPWPGIDRDLVREKNIFYIGRVEKKKSVDVLVKAFSIFHKTNPEWRLILAGKPGYGFEGIKKMIAHENLETSVRLPGMISDEEKKKIFSKSKIFVHPGSNEGSCIPLFEAWDARTPAIVSDAPMLKEIGANGALYFKAGNANDLALKISELAESESLRNELVANGMDNLKKLDWKETAEIILENILY